MPQKSFWTIFVFFMLFSCSNDELSENSADIDVPINNPQKPNILLIIADDFGLDACPGYDVGNEKPFMPTIQSLSSAGITFNNFWSYPVCTPTRASIITGKYGFRTGVLSVDDPLSTSETTIQKYLTTNLAGEYSNAVIGKWHLSKNSNHPNLMGVDYYAGNLSGGLKTYWDWNLVENGIETSNNEYNTSKYTNLAIDWISEQEKPWFLWLAYNAPHSPFHLPPSELHYQGNLPTDESSIAANPLPYYFAMLEAMDTEIGRLLDSMDSTERENTIIIFIGDNGTPNEVVQEYNNRRAKGSLFNGGINVPLIVSGKGVVRFSVKENALVNSTDLYATIANIAGVGVKEINDSKDFSTLFTKEANHNRDYLYSETATDVSIRNATHKYILKGDGTEYLYELSNSLLESKNLMHASNLPLSESDEAAKTELIKKLEEIKN